MCENATDISYTRTEANILYTWYSETSQNYFGLIHCTVAELQVEIIKLSLLSNWIEVEILWLTFDTLLDCN